MSDEGAGDRTGKRANEEEIDSKQLNIQYKRYYVDVKQNSRGRFVKIAEMGSNYKSRLVLTMSAAVMLRDQIQDLIKFSEANPSVASEAENGDNDEKKDKERKGAVTLKSETVVFDSRRYYLDLKENARGRFLRIAQTVPNPRANRSQIAVPAEGITQLCDILTEMIDKHSEGYLTPVSNVDLPKSKQVLSDGKAFYFDAGQNDRGVFVRVSEVKVVSGFRQAVTIPLTALDKFRAALDEIAGELADAEKK